MRFRYLEMAAIGPFHTPTRVDFDALTLRGTFLIEGPTGAGKSTIIDAIVYALYGNVSGSDTSVDRIRSTFASPHEESRVTLIFTTSAGTFKIVRHPKWERAKARGNGTTTINSKVELWKVENEPDSSGHWANVKSYGHSAEEIAREILDIVGLNRAEFVQTVVLPQGEFAKFLHLKSSERQPILEKIFGTQKYTDFTTYLHKEARGARTNVENAFSNYKRCVNTWSHSEAFNPEVQETLTSRIDTIFTDANAYIRESDATLADLITHYNDELAQRNTAQAHRAQELNKTWESAHTQLNAVHELSQKLRKLHELQTERDAIAQREPEIAQLSDALKRAERAQVPCEHIKLLNKRQNSAKRAERELIEQLSCSVDLVNEHNDVFVEAIRKELSYFDSSSQFSDTQTLAENNDSLHQMRDVLLANIESLASSLELEKSLEDRAQRVASLKHSQEELENTLTTVQNVQAQIPGTRSELIKKLEEARQLSSQLEFSESRLEDAEQQRGYIEQYNHLETEETEKQKKLERTLEQYHQRADQHHNLTQRWIASTAALIAEDLVDGNACPVCGSTTHPNLALMPTDAASHEDVVAAEEKVNDARENAHAARVELEQIRERIKAVSALIKNHDAQSVAKEIAQLHEHIASAKAAADEAKQHSEALETLDEQSRSLATQYTDVTAQLASLNSEVIALENDVARDSLLLVEARAWADSVEERKIYLKAISDSLSDVLLSISNVIQSQESLAHTQDECHSAIKESGFSSVEEVTDAQLDPNVIAEYRARIEKHKTTLDGICAQLSAPEMKNLEDVATPDLDYYTTLERDAREQAEKEKALSTRLDVLLHQNRTHEESISHAQSQWRSALKQAGPIMRLASIAEGGLPSRVPVPLHSWILIRRFEKVIDYANSYLQRISSGRYLLERAEGYKRNQKNGLGLAIRDLHMSDESKAVRATSSLSGGETFFTSLCLALGLAEVVRAENGGIHIGTLIIDEGFGTLSDDVRDTLMDTLTELTENGRCVGVISHVSELKQQIPRRISVHPQGDGTSTLKVWA